jgi:hypothetical protein
VASGTRGACGPLLSCALLLLVTQNRNETLFYAILVKHFEEMCNVSAARLQVLRAHVCHTHMHTHTHTHAHAL